MDSPKWNERVRVNTPRNRYGYPTQYQGWPGHGMSRGGVAPGGIVSGTLCWHADGAWHATFARYDLPASGPHWLPSSNGLLTPGPGALAAAWLELGERCLAESADAGWRRR